MSLTMNHFFKTHEMKRSSLQSIISNSNSNNNNNNNNNNNCCFRQDGTRFNIQCAFNYSDNLVIINQVTPVTIQNKNHLEIIQIRTQIKLVI